VGRDQAAARADEVHLDVVHAPGRQQVGVALDVRHGAGLAVVDPVGVVVGVARPGRVGDVPQVVRGALDRQVGVVGGLGDAWGQVDAELQAERVDVGGDR